MCINEKGNIESHKKQDYTLRRTEPHHRESCEINDTGVNTEPSDHYTEENTVKMTKTSQRGEKCEYKVFRLSTNWRAQNRTTSLPQRGKPLPRYETSNMSNKYFVNLKNLERHMSHRIGKQIVETAAKDTKNIPVMERT